MQGFAFRRWLPDLCDSDRDRVLNESGSSLAGEFHRADEPFGMIGLPSSVRIYLSTEPTDMRRGFDGLSSFVLRWGMDLYSGHLFVFISTGRRLLRVQRGLQRR